MSGDNSIDWQRSLRPKYWLDPIRHISGQERTASVYWCICLEVNVIVVEVSDTMLGIQLQTRRLIHSNKGELQVLIIALQIKDIIKFGHVTSEWDKCDQTNNELEIWYKVGRNYFISVSSYCLTVRPFNWLNPRIILLILSIVAIGDSI